ncbi:MAG: hypothetical protein R2728_12265 [Chitinophagales bacterium]
MKNLLIILMAIIGYFSASAQTEKLTELDIALFKIEFVEGCKNSRIKGLDKTQIINYCDCAWEYFEENYTMSDYEEIMLNVSSKRDVAEYMMNDENLLLHLMTCLVGEPEQEMDEESYDEKAAIKAQTTNECIKSSSKKSKKMKGFNIEGYCECASDKLFDTFTLQEVVDKSFKDDERLEQLMLKCLLENME